MEFWGVEVKSGELIKVQPGEGKILHISQACLGEVKKDKGNDYVRVNVQKNGQKFVIGMLSPDRFPNLNLDLVFEDEFELSHDSKHGSVHFSGYRADGLATVNEDASDDDDEIVPIEALNNGRPEGKELQPSGSKANVGVKIEKAENKSKVKIVEPNEDSKNNVEGDNTDDDDDSDDDEVESADNDEEEGEDMTSSGSDEEDDSEEETPKKPEPAKKRPGESTSKTPVPEKKARFSTPQQKADGRKVGGHVATPHPAKHTGKTPANIDKSNKQTPAKTFTCSSCSKTFGSEQAVQSHSKAKHSGN